MLKTSYSKRISLLKQVPNPLRKSDLDKVYCHFGGECGLTGEHQNTTYDHFIPTSWGTVVFKYGIGGHTYANMIMLARRFNESKRAMNPFEWYKKNRARLGIPPKKWKTLIKHVAAKHKLTPEEYEMKVYACHEEVKAIKWMEEVNSWVKASLKAGRYINSPHFLIMSGLWRNLNIPIVVKTYGSEDAKKLLDDETFKTIINDCKAKEYLAIHTKPSSKKRKL